jgi:hypothetical protein
MKERTTKELIEKLGNDINRCHDSIIQAMDNEEVDNYDKVSANYEYHARQLIRSILAYIEGITFSVKVTSVDRCLAAGINVSDHEKYLAVEVDSDLNDKGEIIERPSKLRLTSNVRFAFRLLEKASRNPLKFDPSSEWWSCFCETVRVRDRLMHPRWPQDLDVSPDDILKALKARDGFDKVLLSAKRISKKPIKSISTKLMKRRTISKKRVHLSRRK